MSIKDAAREVFDACRAADENLEVNFDADEITIYWENLRLDVQPDGDGGNVDWQLERDGRAMGSQGTERSP